MTLETAIVGTFFVAWSVGMVAQVIFWVVKKPEYTVNILTQHSSFYWIKRLDEIVPSKWVGPIRKIGALSLALLTVDLVLLFGAWLTAHAT